MLMPLMLLRLQGGKKAATGPTYQNEFFEIAQQLEALKAKLESGREAPAESSSGKPEVNALGYSCDENGCVLLDTNAVLSSGAGPDKWGRAGREWECMQVA